MALCNSAHNSTSLLMFDLKHVDLQLTQETGRSFVPVPTLICSGMLFECITSFWNRSHETINNWFKLYFLPILYLHMLSRVVHFYYWCFLIAGGGFYVYSPLLNWFFWIHWRFQACDSNHHTLSLIRDLFWISRIWFNQISGEGIILMQSTYNKRQTFFDEMQYLLPLVVFGENAVHSFFPFIAKTASVGASSRFINVIHVIYLECCCTKIVWLGITL